ncbi:hypothetical protein CcaverHIS631_0205390 [Cutaneotrichosporon cavernicola]|nr:hypothetical protein CcaverHIS631_0205390 [Cutaneotrichosporon cavernicola]BEJ04723.1 hypothetical protein CcaverHIS641_0205400 [Cutaneotrichosporon cavernicola]
MPPAPPLTPPPPGREMQTTFVDLIRAGDYAVASSTCRLKTSQGGIDADVVVLCRGSQTIKESAVLIVVGSPPRILHVLPINPLLAVALEQAPPSPSTSFFAQSSKARLGISITGTPVSLAGPPVPQTVELQFPAGDTLRVHALVKQIRKAISTSYYSSSSYGWLAYYPVTAPGSPSEYRNSIPASDDQSEGTEGETLVGSETRAKAEPASEGETEGEEGSEPKEGETEQYPNPYVEGFSRPGFLRKRLFSRQDKWSTRKPVSIRIVTYNVNDRVPPPGTKELAPILGYGEEDILVVGLQEADLRSQSLLVSQGDERANAWEVAIFEGLREKEDAYERVAVMQYVGVILLVFAKTPIRPHVRMVQTAARGIGLWGFGGNKAGVALRMKVFDTTVCFVNSHLAAFASQISRRRLDYQALRTTLTFDLMTGLHPPTEAYYPDNGQLAVDDADVLFWFGDLNYRIELEPKEIHALLESRQYETLLSADQLKTDMEDGHSFVGFSEPTITFKPSFKYVHGSVTFDPKRAPAYCDRVLYIARNDEVTPNRYACHDILWSDHLPVTATFSLAARIVDETKRTEELLRCQSELDRLDEIYRPSLTVDVKDVEFGDILYRRPVVREITLRNTGRVPAGFSFREPAPGKPICMPWYWPFPAAGVVPAGEEVVLTLTACVDETLSADLTCGGEMNDVLVLQVQGGKDSLITVHGSFVPTIVGLPLDVVPQLSDVIRNVPLAERKVLLVDSDEWAEAEKTHEFLSAALESDAVEEGESIPVGGGEQTPETEVESSKADESESEPKSSAVDTASAVASDGKALDADAATDADEAVAQLALDTTISGPRTPPPHLGASSLSPTRPRPKRGCSGITRPPREVWRLLERLMEDAMGVERLWTTAPDYSAVLAVIDALDTGAPPPRRHARHRQRPPTHPTEKWACRLIMSRDDAYAVVESIQGVHANVLIGLMSVARLCGGDGVDKDSVLALATAIFGGPVRYREGLVLGLLEG